MSNDQGPSSLVEDQPEPPVMPSPERGKVYDTRGPNGEPLVVMTHDTWLDFGTNMASLRQALSHLSKKVKEYEIGERIMLVRLADLQSRLDNLRTVRRAEVRPDVEAALGITPDPIITEG